VTRSNHVLTGNERFVKVELRYGNRLSSSIVQSLLDAFGEAGPCVY
jgi:hypothetical protein